MLLLSKNIDYIMNAIGFETLGITFCLIIGERNLLNEYN